MSLDAMKQALELLESAHVATDLVWKRYDCITALRAAIEQAQEPVACNNCKEWEKVCDQHLRHIKKLKKSRACQWQGLTADEIWQCNAAPPESAVEYHICMAHQNVLDFAEAIEAKLREKNNG